MEIETGTQEQGQQGAEGAAEESAGPDVGALLGQFGSKLDGFASRFDGLEERLNTAATSGGGEEEAGGGEGEGDEFVPQFAVEDFNESGELTVEAQTRAIQEIAQRQVEAALAPQREQAQAQRRDAYADALEQKYPDLQDEATQNAVFDAAIQQASMLAQITGRPELAELWREPEYLEVVYLAEQAKKRAGDEVPAGSEREVTLERGGAAGPAAQSGQGDDGDRIVAVAQKSRFRLGS